MIEAWSGSRGSWPRLRDALKAGEFRPVPVRERMIPKGQAGEGPEAGYCHRR